MLYESYKRPENQLEIKFLYMDTNKLKPSYEQTVILFICATCIQILILSVAFQSSWPEARD